MGMPQLVINLRKIEENSRQVVERAKKQGIAVVGVTKSCCGSLPVARAMLRGGVSWLGDSRLSNLVRLRRNFGSQVPLLYLRLPMLSEVEQVVGIADVSLNSQPEVLTALNQAACKLGKRHGVILMIDVGDLREGRWPTELPQLDQVCTQLKYLDIIGVGTNLTCFGGVMPSQENMELLLQTGRALAQATGREVTIVSGGNSSSLPLLWQGAILPGINQLRIGEGILLGLETALRQPMPGLHQDAFLLQAEIIEIATKPTLPVGKTTQNAYGEVADWQDRGWRKRAILAFGRQDTAPSGLTPLDSGVEILGASSDHIVIDIEESPKLWRIGDKMTFLPGYGALVGAMTSAYVKKRYVEGTK